MKKLSVKRISVLGSMLVVASVVTAAILPKHKKTNKLPGALWNDTDDGMGGYYTLTCKPAYWGQCTYTVGSTLNSTFNEAIADSYIVNLDNEIQQTWNNTSITDFAPGTDSVDQNGEPMKD